jgi:hypothetical protein
MRRHNSGTGQARPSSAGAGRARKIGRERSRAISTIGTFAAASTASSARPPTSPARGSSAAVPSTAVAVPPTATSNGTSADPTASPAIAKASATPKTRPTTSAGTARCSSVRVARLNRARPPPTTASSTTVAAAVVDSALSASAALIRSRLPRIGVSSRRRPTRAIPARPVRTPPTP